LTLLQRFGIVLDHLPIVGTLSPGQPETPLTHRVTWVNEADTEAFAHTLAQQPALREATLALRGDLGAGKTTLMRHLLRALGVRGRIKSPTYAVVEPYTVATSAGETWTVHHFDFYRFNDPREWEDAGFREIFAGPGLKVCEWPEQAGGLLSVIDLDIHLHVQDDEQRVVILQARTPRGELLLRGLAA
jgi:tRNA threonylcarbamoyladenosine biosynthesis protein TsaE